MKLYKWHGGSSISKWQRLAQYLPPKLVYFAAIRLLSRVSTDDKYANIVAGEFRAMETIVRYAELENL